MEPMQRSFGEYTRDRAIVQFKHNGVDGSLSIRSMAAFSASRGDISLLRIFSVAPQHQPSYSGNIIDVPWFVVLN